MTSQLDLLLVSLHRVTVHLRERPAHMLTRGVLPSFRFHIAMSSSHFVIQHPTRSSRGSASPPAAGTVERAREEDDQEPVQVHVAPASSSHRATASSSTSTASHKSRKPTTRNLPTGPAASSPQPPPAQQAESKDELEALPPPPRSSAATAALEAASSESEDDAAATTAANATAGSGDAEEEEKPTGPSAAEIYARPLLFYKRAVDRRRQGGDRSADSASELGPAQLLLPDKGMALGFPPLKEPARGNRRREEPNDGDAVVVFTPPNEEQASKTKLWACILFFLIPADVILICVIFFLGSAKIGNESYDAGTTDLVTFLCALIALCLGLLGMKLRDTRILTLFITVYYVDAIINLVRVSSILQLAQFFMQIGVCYSMGHFKSSLIGTWWVADT